MGIRTMVLRVYLFSLTFLNDTTSGSVILSLSSFSKPQWSLIIVQILDYLELLTFKQKMILSPS